MAIIIVVVMIALGVINTMSISFISVLAVVMSGTSCQQRKEHDDAE